MFSGICVKVTPNVTYKGDEKYTRQTFIIFYTPRQVLQCNMKRAFHKIRSVLTDCKKATAYFPVNWIFWVT